MTTAGEIAALAFGTFVGLGVLSVLAETLRARVPEGRRVSGVETFAARVRSWWAMAILLGIGLLLGPWAVVLLVALAAFAALREFATYTAKAREDHLGLALAFFVVLPLQFLFVGLGKPGIFTIFVPVYAFAGLSVLAALRGSPQKFLARVAETQWALMICVYGASHLAAFVVLPFEGAALLIPFLVLCVQTAEIVDGAAGRRWRGRAVAPQLSPRTWRGGAAGAAAAAAVGVALFWLTPFGVLGAGVVGALAAVAGLSGTLVLAAVKRERGVRDWSHLIPGQGGVLDLWGGAFFAAPLVWHLAHWGWG